MSETVFLMLVGLPGSGKTFQSRLLRDRYSAVYLGSDDLRAVFGTSKNDQSVTKKVFRHMEEKTIEALKSGQSVVYDATNISAARRRNFLEKLEGIKCRKVCVELTRSYDACKEALKGRDHDVPEYVLWRMSQSYETPSFEEGWDEIISISTDRLIEGGDFNGPEQASGSGKDPVRESVEDRGRDRISV